MATKKVNIDIIAKDKSKRALNNVRGSLDKLKSSVFNVRNALAGLGAGLVIRNLVNTGKEIEGLKVRLKFLFGSVEEGAKAFDKMAEFASRVPFSLQEIQAGSGNLAVVAKDADELAHLMEIAGNVAAATGLDFQTTAEQIQRSFSAGIGAADLFRDRGVRAMLGFQAGATVSIEETKEAFNKVFGAGGEFGGTTDALAQTLEGTLSMIGDKIFNFKKELLDAGFFAELKRQFGDLDKFLQDNAESLDELARNIGTGLAKAVVALSEGVKILAENFSQLKAFVGGFIAFKLASVIITITKAVRNLRLQTIGLVALTGPRGLALIAGAFVAMKIAASDFIAEVKKADTALKDLTMQGIVSQISALSEQISILENRNKDLKNSIQDVADGGEKMDGHFDFLNDTLDMTPEKLTLIQTEMEQNKRIISELNAKLVELNKLLDMGGNQSKKIIDLPHALLEHEATPEEVNERTKKEKEKAQKIKDILEQNRIDSVKIFHETQRKNEEINIKAQIARIKREQEEIEAEKEKAKEIEKILLQNKLDGMIIHQEMLEEKLRLNNIEVEAEQEKQRKLIALQKEGKESMLSNTRDSLRALSGLNRSGFEAFKRFQIAEATINAISGAATAFKTFAGNPFMATFVAASHLAKGMAMVAKIKATNFREKGGPVSQGKPFIVGEKGPELFVPNQSGNIVANNKMGGSPVAVTFNINTVDARGFNELLTNSRGTIVSLINSAVNETGRQAVV